MTPIRDTWCRRRYLRNQSLLTGITPSTPYRDHPPLIAALEFSFASRTRVFAFGCLIHLLAHSGLRIGEALALAWKDVDFAASTVRVTSTLVEAAGKVERGDPKTFAGTRTVHLSASVMERLRVQRVSTGTVFKVGGFVFSSANGGPLRISNFRRRRWHPLLKELGFETCGFHSLRHSHASMLVTRAKVDPVTVAERLGHADAGMTLQVYSHPDEERSSEAADAFGEAIARPDAEDQDEAGGVSPE